MYRMDKTTIVQETEKVLAKISVIGYDNRTGKSENLIIFAELTSEEQDASTVAKKALRELGYLYSGIENVDTTSVPFNAEGFYLVGKEKEEEDLNRR